MHVQFQVLNITLGTWELSHHHSGISLCFVHVACASTCIIRTDIAFHYKTHTLMNLFLSIC